MRRFLAVLSGVVLMIVGLAVPADAATSAAQRIGGVWEGAYYCKGETLPGLGVDLRITVQRKGKLRAVLSFYPLVSQPFTSAGAYTLTGTYTSKKVTLHPAVWIRNPGGLLMSTFSGKLPAKGKAFSGAVCGGRFSFKRGAKTVKAAGSWSGTYQCKRGPQPFTLSVAQHKGTAISAVVDFPAIYLNGHVLYAHGRYTMKGYNYPGGHILLRFEAWIIPATWLTVSIVGNLKGNRMTGFMPSWCQEFELTRK